MASIQLVSVLLLSLCLSCTGQLTVVSPIEIADEYKNIFITPFRKYLGLQTGNTTRELKYFDDSEIAKYCNKVLSDEEKKTLKETYRGKIAVLPHYFDIGCLGNDDRFISYEFFVEWCSITKTAIHVKDFIPGLYYNDHDGMYFNLFKGDHPTIRNCAAYEVRNTTQFQSLLDYSKNSSVFVHISPQNSPCAEVFESTFATILYRGILGISYIVTGFVSLVGLVSPSRIRKENQRLNTIVLSSNTVTIIIIGFTLVRGGWRLTPDVTEATNSFVMPLFFGSSTATDYLIACRWSQIKQNTHFEFRAQFQEKKQTFFEKCFIVFAVLVSIVLISADWVSSILLVNVTTKNISFLAFYVPVFFALMQFWVICYLTYQVICMIRILKTLQSFLMNSVSSKEKMDVFTKQAKTISHLKLWVSVSIASAVLSLLVLILLAVTKVLDDTCEGWVGMWALFLVAKLGNVVSQNAVCIPRRPLSTVAPKLSTNNPLKALM